MNVRAVTGIVTAGLVVVGGIGCAQNRDRSEASSMTPTTTAAMDTKAQTSPTPMASTAPATSTTDMTPGTNSAMGSNSTMGASAPYMAPAATGTDSGMRVADNNGMRPPQSDRN